MHPALWLVCAQWRRHWVLVLVLVLADLLFDLLALVLVSWARSSLYSIASALCMEVGGWTGSCWWRCWHSVEAVVYQYDKPFGYGCWMTSITTMNHIFLFLGYSEFPRWLPWQPIQILQYPKIIQQSTPI